MSDSRPSRSSVLMCVLLPLLLALAVVVATLILSGSRLIVIEDVYANRILAGTYGKPDWRVQTMNPLLAQIFTALYWLTGSVNWYGAGLLLLLALSAASALGIAAQKRGLIVSFLMISPILVLLTNSLQSAPVAALCAASGALSAIDGFARKRAGLIRTICGGLLFAAGAALSIWWAAAGAAVCLLCCLPGAVREKRIGGVMRALPLLAVVLATLYGYAALMYIAPEHAAYRKDYAAYESLQRSALREECFDLLETYGTTAYSEEHAGHDHTDADEAAHETEHAEPVETVFSKAVGWSLNDAVLFFTRNTADASLTDPETVAALLTVAKGSGFRLGDLLSSLWETIKKPQILLVMGLYVLSALWILLTARRRGLIVLLTAVIAFGGHIGMLLTGRDAFMHIAPCYLLAMFAALWHADGDAALSALDKLRSRMSKPLMAGLVAIVLLGYLGGMGGLVYYTSITDPNNSATRPVAEAMRKYIVEHKETLFIGDNPADRIKPDSLEAPVRGQDENLLAGSYDLYSPRAAALMQAFSVTNPLPELISREDMAYVAMAFTEMIDIRFAEAYPEAAEQANLQPVFAMMNYSERIYANVPAEPEPEVVEADVGE